MRAAARFGDAPAITMRLAAEDTGGRIVRPSIPPVLCGAASLWVGALASAQAVIDSSIGVSWAGLSPGIVLGLSLGVMALLGAFGAGMGARLRLFCLFVAVGYAVGIGAAWVGTAETLNQGRTVIATPPGHCTFVVESDPRLSARGRWSFQATVIAPGGKGRVWVDAGQGDETPPAMGSLVAIEGTWEQLDGAREFDRSLLLRGVAARVRARSIEVCSFQGGILGMVRGWRASLLAALDAEGSAARSLLAGVVCGAQALCARAGITEDFSRLGLSHLVAVSGTHLSVAGAVLGRVLGWLRVRPASRLGALALVLGIYVVFTGLQVSALRAWIMVVVGLGAPVAGRRGHSLASVGAAAALMLVMDPACATSVGFQLSVLSVVGLAMFVPLAKGWLSALLPGVKLRWLIDGCALTLVSQACTAPVALPLFATVPLLAPVANVLAVPLVTALLVGGLAVAPLMVLVPPLGLLLAVPLEVLAHVLCVGTAWMARLPGVAPMVEVSAEAAAFALGIAGIVVYRFWPRPSPKRARLLAGVAVGLAVVAVVRWGSGSPPRMVVMDVGQGDAILIQDGTRAVLVDVGLDDAVCKALTRNRVMRLDAVVLTHTDLDHIGGLTHLSGRVAVDRIVVARGVEAGLLEMMDQAGVRMAIPIVEVDAGDAIRVGRFLLTVLWPREPVVGDENGDSLVMLAELATGEGHRFRGLLTGDAEQEVLDPLVSDGTVGAIDILKVGHHGSTASTSRTMMEALTPAVAIASAGEGNRYGHPTEVCVATLEEGGAIVLCTKDAGDVEVRPGDEGIRVRCAKTGGVS